MADNPQPNSITLTEDEVKLVNNLNQKKEKLAKMVEIKKTNRKYLKENIIFIINRLDVKIHHNIVYIITKCTCFFTNNVDRTF